MSVALEQATRERILTLLDEFGIPDAGSLHVIQEGAKPTQRTEAIDPAFHPESAVILLIPQGGDYMDGQCYDAQGYPVYAD